jgi:two-component system, NtrC family, sensor kinase
MPAENEPNRRILVIDDNPAIHDDFRKSLGCYTARPPAALLDLEAQLFGDASPVVPDEQPFEVVSALQGSAGLGQLIEAISEGKPFALAFVDIRMPPGWDGVETIERLWKVDPDLQVVICSAYSDYTGDDIRHRLGDTDGLLILKKPFDTAEVTQVAHAMTRKWSLQRAQRDQTTLLDALVHARTSELETANRRLAAEMLHRERIEAELRLAQKLESIGQLAAGIAHEINTPAQYVSDNMHFLRSSFEDLERLRAKLRTACAVRDANREYRESLDDIDVLEREIDLDYLTAEVPLAFQSAHNGLERIRSIVQAMRVFGRHDSSQKSTTDVNRLVSSTIEVSRHEYRHVADIDLQLGTLPPVLCNAGEISQVFLNLIVNAAHAIESIVKDTGTRGRIAVRTELADSCVVISVADTGCGIPEAIRARIFDPFFTTKDVGRGTGQGLSIARSIIVDRHSGSISVDSVVGQGTTFTVRFPTEGPAAS